MDKWWNEIAMTPETPEMPALETDSDDRYLRVARASHAFRTI